MIAALTSAGLEGGVCIAPAPEGRCLGLHVSSLPTASGTEPSLPIQASSSPAEKGCPLHSRGKVDTSAPYLSMRLWFWGLLLFFYVCVPWPVIFVI